MSATYRRFCPRCGAAVEEDDLFCIYCGEKLRKAGESGGERPGYTGGSAAGGREEYTDPVHKNKPDTGYAGTGRAAGSGTGAGSRGAAGAGTGSTGRKKSAAPYIVLALLAAVLVYTQFFSSSKVYKDVDAAGEYLREQILKQEEPLHVSYNSEKNMLLTDFLVDDLIQASMVYTGNPLEGDRLAMLCWPDSYEGTQVKKSNGSYDYNLKIHMDYLLTEQQEKDYEKAAQDILTGLHLEGASDYEKIRAIYQYICSHVTYDYENLEDDSYMLKYTGYAAVINHTAVCAGIAELFYYLANSAGVETHIRTSSNHAWNFVKLSGKYYYIDATWDLGLSENEYQYFLKGKYDFEDHMSPISFSLWKSATFLNTAYLDYDFSEYAYGYAA